MFGKQILFAALAASLAACASGHNRQPASTGAPQPSDLPCPGLDFGPADNGKTLRVQRSGYLRFVAEGNPTTGYNWFAREFDASLLALDPDRDGYNPSSDLVGAGGTLAICLKAVGSGTTPLQMVYERSWESNTEEPLRQVSVTVVISE